MICQLTLEPSEADGYQVIKYPNTEGISITGQGFLTEAILVEVGKSYNYYKTYEDSITKGKFYPKDTNLRIVLIMQIKRVFAFKMLMTILTFYHFQESISMITLMIHLKKMTFLQLKMDALFLHLLLS